MALKLMAKRTIPCSLGTCHEDQWCPHVVQTALAANIKGALAVRTTPIVAGNVGEGEELLAHPSGIVLRQQLEEEELVLRHEVPLDELDGARCPSLASCPSTAIMH